MPIVGGWGASFGRSGFIVSVEAGHQWSFSKPGRRAHGAGADQTRVETAHPGGSLCTDFPGSGTGDGGHISEADRVQVW